MWKEVMPPRAADSDWQSGDAIGLTMYDENFAAPINGVYNSQYVTTAPDLGIFNPATEDQTIYFPQNGNNVGFTAYYPYQAGITSNMLLDWSVSDQLVLPDIDLMTAEHTSGYSKTTPDVSLHFHHRLSKLIFNLSIENDGDFVSLEDCQLTLKGMYTSTTYDLFNDEFVSITNEENISVPQRDTESDNYREAIVLPRDAADGIEFEFVTSTGDTYTAYMSPDLALEGGHQYTFNLTLTRTPITVSAIIEPWQPGGTYNYDILHVSTKAGESTGAVAGDEMNVYIQSADDDTFSPLTPFTYSATGEWVPDTTIYWEDLAQDPAVLRASIIRAPARNNTQLPDILIADQLSVPAYTGANFTLRHAASQVIVQLTSSTFSEQDIRNATLTLPDYLTGGYESLGTFVEGTTRADILVDRSDLTNGIAIFQPQTISGSDPLLRVNINGRDYEATEPNGFTFEAGVAYRILVNVGKTRLTVSVTVVDWIYRDIELDAVTIGTSVSGGTGVNNGEQLILYYGDDTSRERLNTYTYVAATDSFTSTTPTYWESLPDPTHFYASITRDGYNGTNQIPDYLVGDTTVAASDGVHFTLRHAAAQVVVELTSNDGTFTEAELQAMNLTLPNYRIGGTLEDGVFVPNLTSTGNIEMFKTDSTAIALIQPQDRTNGSPVVEIRSANRTYTATHDQTINFEAGVTTLLTVDMSKTEVTLSATVLGWEEGQRITMTASTVTVTGTLQGTDSFFYGKNIYLYYPATDPGTPLTYTYSLNASGDTVWSGTPIYWDDIVNNNLNITGVYSPLAEEPTVTGTTFPWTIGRIQDDANIDYYDRSDLLMSNLKLTQPQPANFLFRHVTSKAIIKLVPGTGFEGVTSFPGATVRLLDFNLKGLADISTATITSSSGPDNVTPKTETDGVQYSALVMPQNKAVGDTILSITLAEYPDTPFYGVLTEALSFEGGKETVITVRLDKTQVLISAKLQNWQDGDEGEIVIK
ncbi:MAG: fimbrillin family protein [Tannerellaceae bacterium]|nr:fimbrillin family protein [Tannerellaceae bacterium]